MQRHLLKNGNTFVTKKNFELYICIYLITKQVKFKFWFSIRDTLNELYILVNDLARINSQNSQF